jgi:hypothetical protein
MLLPEIGVTELFDLLVQLFLNLRREKVGVTVFLKVFVQPDYGLLALNSFSIFVHVNLLAYIYYIRMEQWMFKKGIVQTYAAGA